MKFNDTFAAVLDYTGGILRANRCLTAFQVVPTQRVDIGRTLNVLKFCTETGFTNKSNRNEWNKTEYYFIIIRNNYVHYILKVQITIYIVWCVVINLLE